MHERKTLPVRNPNKPTLEQKRKGGRKSSPAAEAH